MLLFVASPLRLDVFFSFFLPRVVYVFLLLGPRFCVVSPAVFFVLPSLLLFAASFVRLRVSGCGLYLFFFFPFQRLLHLYLPECRHCYYRRSWLLRTIFKYINMSVLY